MATLIRNVFVNGQGWGPGHGNADQVPDDVAAQITNPTAWDQTKPEQADKPAAASPSIDPVTASAIVENAGQLAASVLLDLLAQVPQDKPALADFAATHGIEVDNRLGAVKLREAIAEALQDQVEGE